MSTLVSIRGAQRDVSLESAILEGKRISDMEALWLHTDAELG